MSTPGSKREGCPAGREGRGAERKRGQSIRQVGRNPRQPQPAPSLAATLPPGHPGVPVRRKCYVYRKPQMLGLWCGFDQPEGGCKIEVRIRSTLLVGFLGENLTAEPKFFGK